MACVLVVDDDAGVREIVSRMLQKYQHCVELAEDGSEALGKLTDCHFDLVVSDLKMPVMDGDTLLMNMRAQGDETPFLMMSGHVQCAGSTPFLVDDFLPKPFMLADLMEKVETLLNKPVIA